jgi:hypothetical protein
MNSPSESVGVAAVRILSRMMERRRAARSRRYRPLAEPMEARAVLSHVILHQAITHPIAVGHSPSAIVDGRQDSFHAASAHARLHLEHGPAAPSGLRPMDTVEVNGQVEVQPGT